jgi:hypothetical protein
MHGKSNCETCYKTQVSYIARVRATKTFASVIVCLTDGDRMPIAAVMLSATALDEAFLSNSHLLA